MIATKSSLYRTVKEERTTVRLDVRMKGSLREHGRSSFTIDVLDLSVTGCRVETACELDIGARIWLKFPRLVALPTTIMWREGYRYGCEFEQALHIAVFDHIVKRYRAR